MIISVFMFRYFVTFDLVRESVTGTERGDLDRRLAKCSNPQETGLFSFLIVYKKRDFMHFFSLQVQRLMY